MRTTPTRRGSGCDRRGPARRRDHGGRPRSAPVRPGGPRHKRPLTDSIGTVAEADRRRMVALWMLLLLSPMGLTVLPSHGFQRPQRHQQLLWSRFEPSWHRCIPKKYGRTSPTVSPPPVRPRSSRFTQEPWHIPDTDPGKERVVPETRRKLNHKDSPAPQSKLQTSSLLSIQVTNLAGFIGGDPMDSTLTIHFPNVTVSRFTAVTGNSASGKTLLLAKPMDLLAGAKASASLVPTDAGQARVRARLRLQEPHRSAVRRALEQCQLDTVALDQSHELTLERTLSVVHSHQAKRRRLQSTCRINDQIVPLKLLAALAQPLLVVVDASTAAVALAQEDARRRIVDMGVPADCRLRARYAQQEYHKCRLRREQLQRDVSPTSKLLADLDDQQDWELLQHYNEELDALELRTRELGRMLREGAESEHGLRNSGSSEMTTLCRKLAGTRWSDSPAGEKDGVFRSAYFDLLVSLRDCMVELDGRIAKTQQLIDSLDSLSSPASVATAVERSRQLLFEATKLTKAERKDNKAVSGAAEKVHELLNTMEEALSDCVRSIEDEERGLLNEIILERSCCPVPQNLIDALIADWGSLARKHGVGSYQLPACHLKFQEERHQSAKARELLPQAIVNEKDARQEFQLRLEDLMTERKKVAAKLEDDVNECLPLLSMDDSIFSVEMDQPNLSYDVSVDFHLVPRRLSSKEGPLHDVASSGEKSRILLAIENSLPGSVGAMSRGKMTQSALLSDAVPPIAVVYDEIDAHVGGSSANALASLLAAQSGNCQVIAITHSPPVAALADQHLVVTKVDSTGNDAVNVASQRIVTVKDLSGSEREAELARMASGDLAATEAQSFAEALIREGARRRDEAKSSK